MLTACSDDSDNSGIREIQLTPEESGIAEGQQRFAFELFDEIKGNTDNDKNSTGAILFIGALNKI